MNRALLATALLAGISPLCAAQSFNIDFAPAGSAGPSSTYAAAGLPGFWNVVDGGVLANLRNLDGSMSSVPNFVHLAVVPSVQPLPGPTGDDALLLDSFYSFSDVAVSFTINGLANGNYNLIFYGLNPTGSTTFGVPPEPIHVISGGWTGQLTLGQTHTIVPATVTDGTIHFFAVGSIVGVGRFAGMQIIQVPAPSAAGALALGALGLMARRRR
jgi:hypothetical protein